MTFMKRTMTMDENNWRGVRKNRIILENEVIRLHVIHRRFPPFLCFYYGEVSIFFGQHTIMRGMYTNNNV